MVVRGAPAIGVSGAMGLALGIQNSAATTLPALTAEVAVIAEHLAATAPPPSTSSGAIGRIRDLYNTLAAKNTPIPEIKQAVVAEARRMYDEDIAACRQMGRFGADLLPQEGTVLTHCNAGALATCATALRSASSRRERGHKIDVLADETRPSCKARVSPHGS